LFPFDRLIQFEIHESIDNILLMIVNWYFTVWRQRESLAVETVKWIGARALRCQLYATRWVSRE